MLAIIGWVFLIVLCVAFTFYGAAWFVLVGLFETSGSGPLKKWIGAIIFVGALTGLYNVSKVSPFSLQVDTHVYQEHK